MTANMSPGDYAQLHRALAICGHASKQFCCACQELQEPLARWEFVAG